MRNYKLVAVEGIDGSGKSEILPIIVAELARLGLHTAEWPTIENRQIRKLYKKLVQEHDSFPSPQASTYLALADYASSLEDVPADADVLVADRYIYSALADAKALGHSVGEGEILESFKTPDLTIYIDVEPIVALSRKTTIAVAEAGGPNFLKSPYQLRAGFVEYQTKVHDAFATLIQSSAWGNVKVVNGSRCRLDVQKDVLKSINEHFASSPETVTS